MLPISGGFSHRNSSLLVENETRPLLGVATGVVAERAPLLLLRVLRALVVAAPKREFRGQPRGSGSFLFVVPVGPVHPDRLLIACGALPAAAARFVNRRGAPPPEGPPRGVPPRKKWRAGGWFSRFSAPPRPGRRAAARSRSVLHDQGIDDRSGSRHPRSDRRVSGGRPRIANHLVVAGECLLAALGCPQARCSVRASRASSRRPSGRACHTRCGPPFWTTWTRSPATTTTPSLRFSRPESHPRDACPTPKVSPALVQLVFAGILADSRSAYSALVPLLFCRCLQLGARTRTRVCTRTRTCTHTQNTAGSSSASASLSRSRRFPSMPSCHHCRAVMRRGGKARVFTPRGSVCLASGALLHLRPSSRPVLVVYLVGQFGRVAAGIAICSTAPVGQPWKRQWSRKFQGARAKDAKPDSCVATSCRA